MRRVVYTLIFLLTAIWQPMSAQTAQEKLVSPDGRVFGKMGHSERRTEWSAQNINFRDDQKIFESGVEYFK